jgi:hypothetical protein
MTAAPSLSWPAGRTLAGWWPSLTRWQPRALWLSHLILHRIEAAVHAARPSPAAQMYRFLLEALAKESTPAERLAARLGIDAPLLASMLRELQTAALVFADDSGWRVTPAGSHVLASGIEVAPGLTRRTFFFAEGETPGDQLTFLPLDLTHAQPWSGFQTWNFDLSALRRCVDAPDEWKQLRGFPEDVLALPVAEGGDWQRVIVDHPEHLLLLLLQSEEDSLIGLTVQPGDGNDLGDRPVLACPAGWREVLPQLGEPSGEEWRDSWRAWGHSRGLPTSELEACHLERSGVRIRVRAPRPMVERLQTARSDACNGEAWLLAGSGERTRSAALVELVEEG